MILFGRLYTAITGTSSSSYSSSSSSSSPSLSSTVVSIGSRNNNDNNKYNTASSSGNPPGRTVQKRPRADSNSSNSNEDDDDEEEEYDSNNYRKNALIPNSTIGTTTTTPSVPTTTGAKRLRISPSSSSSSSNTNTLSTLNNDNDSTRSNKFTAYAALTTLADIAPQLANNLRSNFSNYLYSSVKHIIGGNTATIATGASSLLAASDTYSSRPVTSGLGLPSSSHTNLLPRLESLPLPNRGSTSNEDGNDHQTVYTIGSNSYLSQPINPVQSLHILRSRGTNETSSFDNSSTALVPITTTGPLSSSSSSSRFHSISYSSTVRPPASLLSTSTLIQQPPEPNPNSLYFRVLEENQRRKQQQYLQSLSSSSSSVSSSSLSSLSSAYIPSFSEHLDTVTSKRIDDALTTLKSLQVINDDMNTIQLLDDLIFKRTKTNESTVSTVLPVSGAHKKKKEEDIIDLLESDDDDDTTANTVVSRGNDNEFERAVTQWKQSLSSTEPYRWITISDHRLTKKDYETLCTVMYPSSLHTLLHNAPSYRDTIIGRCDSEIVTLEKLQCLLDEGWLNDEVVNFHMKQLFLSNNFHFSTRSNRTQTFNSQPSYFLNGFGCHSVSGEPPRVWVCSSFFLTTLMGISVDEDNQVSSIHAPRLYSHSGVAKWSKRAGIDLSVIDLVIVPINIPNTHWALAVLDVNRCSLHYYDSMNSNSSIQTATVGDILNYSTGTLVSNKGSQSSSFRYQVCASIAGWAVDEWKTNATSVTTISTTESASFLSTIDPSSWLVTIYPSTHVPQQSNYYDCGIFMCCFATAISQGKKFTFTQADMPYERRKLILDIVQAK